MMQIDFPLDEVVQTRERAMFILAVLLVPVGRFFLTTLCLNIVQSNYPCKGDLLFLYPRIAQYGANLMST